MVFLCLYGSEKLYLRNEIKRPVVLSCLTMSKIFIGPDEALKLCQFMKVFVCCATFSRDLFVSVDT